MPAPRPPDGAKGTADLRAHAEPLEIAKRRSMPDLYVLDPSFRVVLHWHSGRQAVSERLIDGESGFLVAAADRVVRSVTADINGTEALAIVPPSLILRIVELTGPAGLHYGVFAERYQARDHLREAAKRYGISRRESEVLNLLVQGSATAEIAGTLHIAETTVQDHIKNIAAKTNARSRTEIVAKVLGPGA